MKKHTQQRLSDLEMAQHLEEHYGITAEEVAGLDAVGKVEHALLLKALGGDLAAMEFYLTNKAPEQWKPVQKQSGQPVPYLVPTTTQPDISDAKLREELERRGLMPKVRQLDSKRVDH